MGIVVMAHTKNVFKEFFLPVVNNTDYSITLDKTLFSLSEDFSLAMEVVNNQWNFIKSEKYKLEGSNGESYFGQPLRHNDLVRFIPERGQAISLIITGTESSFQSFRKYDISKLNRVTIGSHSSNNIQFDYSGYISRNHAVLEYTQSGWVIYDQSSNGTFMESRRINSSAVLKFGDCITIFGLRIVFLGNVLAVGDKFGTTQVVVNGLPEYVGIVSNGQNVATQVPEKKFFKRSPRNILKLCTDTVEIEGPPQLRVQKEKPLMMIIGPSFTMTIPMLLGSALMIVSTLSSGNSRGVYMFTGIITAIGSAVMGAFWAMSNLKYERQQRAEEAEQRFNAYGQYLIEIADTLKSDYEFNQRAMHEMYLSSSDCCRYTESTPELWNRNFSHEDFLAVRLGLGSVPFQVSINIPKKKFELSSDELNQKPEQLKRGYEVLQQVPVCIDLLAKRLVGIVGGPGRHGAFQVVLDMVAQIAVNNCYTDVKMIFLYENKTEEDRSKWGFAKWLPHVWSEDKKVRFVAENKTDVSDVAYELSRLLRVRTEEESHDRDGGPVKPHYILFVENPKLLEGELLSKYALEPKEEYGLTTILMVEKYDELPNFCEDIIQNDGTASRMYNVTESSDQTVDLTFDQIPYSNLEQLARRLADIEVNESVSTGEIPASLDFFEMYGVGRLRDLNVLERWTKNRTYDSMRALIGKKGGASDCYLDIHEKYHGPHGLVAGTTGSGKSETLQTYMLSLAVNFSPYDIGFFIIDFKGGGMANLFSNLPHLIGQISNLSGNQVRRAMISIKSEIMRRQRIFTENSVNNINLYTRLVKNGEANAPVPHLFIIIDEFAELKREEPEFMKELISVAQVGRSLGVHLILATQKPSGTVDDNIWSNSKFRLCLRVQDRQDSNDMLHKPDAAYITQAGRGYLQVGNDEVYELFQSGYSGAAYDEEMAVSKGAIASMLTLTGKAALVGNRMKRKKKEQRRAEWLRDLAQIAKDSAYEFGYSVSEAVEPSKFERVASRIFSVLSETEYVFEDSAANRGHLGEFMVLLASTEGLGDERQIEYICNIADSTRKKLPEVKDKTQLEAVVDYLQEIALENRYEMNLALWLPVLPQMLVLNELSGYGSECFNRGNWPEIGGKWNLDVMVGLYDDPENQAQNPLVINLADNGHHAICGTIVTGKSTFLQTFVYAMINKYTPAHVNFYMLDFSSHMLSAFENVAHVGGVMYDTDTERISKFFHMLETMMEERKNLLKGGNYSQYVQANGVVVPAVVVIIDNFATFKEKTDSKYENTILQLSREGVGYGIFLVVTSAGFGAMEIPNRIGDNIRTVISLEMGDRFKFAEVLRVTRVEVLPETDVKGRGLAKINDRILEFQTAVSVSAEDDYKRAELIKERCEQLNAAWKGAYARRIPEIPEKPMLLDFAKASDYGNMLRTRERLPVAYHLEDASYYGVSLRRNYCYLISGKSRTGKTNYLKNLIYAAGQMDDVEICVIENSGTELDKIAGSVNAKYLVTDQQVFDYFKSTIDTFKARNQKKRELLAEGMEDDEVFDVMKAEKPVFIFIANLVNFAEGVYRKLENGSSMSGYLENIIEKGRLHQFYFFACLNTDEAAKGAGYKAYTSYVNYKEGIHLGGNLGAQRIFSFSNIPFAEQNKSAKVGTGLAVSEEDPSMAETIVIPLAKGV